MAMQVYNFRNSLHSLCLINKSCFYIFNIYSLRSKEMWFKTTFSCLFYINIINKKTIWIFISNSFLTKTTNQVTRISSFLWTSGFRSSSLAIEFAVTETTMFENRFEIARFVVNFIYFELFIKVRKFNHLM